MHVLESLNLRLVIKLSNWKTNATLPVRQEAWGGGGKQEMKLGHRAVKAFVVVLLEMFVFGAARVKDFGAPGDVYCSGKLASSM